MAFGRLAPCLVGFLLFGAGCSAAGDHEPVGRTQEAVQILNAPFNSNSEGFVYVDDPFGTNRPSNASGTWSSQQLHVSLNYTGVTSAKSGGWRYTFTGPGTATVAFDWFMRRPNFDLNECTEVRVMLDGTYYGTGGNQYLTRRCDTATPTTTSGRFTFTTPQLASGTHTLTIGGRLSSNNATNETMVVDIDNVTIDLVAPPACGDLLCNGTETCSTCPGDCGSCCGNGSCGTGETCSSCPADCGACPTCGDGSCNGTETCASCPGDCPCPQPFVESGGMVVMEAESFSGKVAQGMRDWVQVSDANASGGLAYQASPNSGLSVNTGYITGSPRLDFPVTFSQTGTYTVWIRGRDPDNPYQSTSDSVHAGIDNTGPASSDRIGSFASSFGWIRATLDNVNATISVTSAGTHVINVWMREDGFIIDKLLLTTNTAFTPTGLGPAESPRGSGPSCGDGSCNGTETCASCPGDCVCPPTCGDGSCSGTETCANCVSDCCGLSSRPSNASCFAPPAPGTGYSFNQIWSEIPFIEPVGIVQAPNDANTFYVVQKTGKVRRLPRTATMPNDVSDFLNLEGVVDTGGPPNAGGEGGLLAVAFPPSQGAGPNFTMYVSYTIDRAVPGTVFMHRISRFRSPDSGQTWTEEVLIEHPKEMTNHNAGDLAFGLDGYLYISLGDDAYQNPTRAANAANLDMRYGKVLRIDVSPATGYAIPSNNPFAGTGVRREVFAYGFRNPWRLSIDRSNGALWVGDVGEDTWEEIDLVTSAGFYGWPNHEADQCRPTGTCTTPYTSPREAYLHNGVPKSITGGYVYRGPSLTDLVGQYVYGDYITGEVWAYDAALDTSRSVDPTGGPLSSFGQDNSGELYAVRFASGTIEKLEAAAPPGGGYPQLLSDTGCFTSTSPVLPATGVIPYSIALPFWSDGLLKDRFFALPNGTTMSVANDGDFTLPPGAVTIKNFRQGTDLIETRFFVRHSDGSYTGYTYQWNAQQTQATLVPASGATRALTGLTWTYPSRSACLACHTEGAGRSLGLETRQINIDTAYPLTTFPSTGLTANQLATLDGIGMLSGTRASLTPFASLDNTGVPIQERAKAYLHVNCSNCHRPGGIGRGPMDARFDTLFGDMRICNEPPTLGNLGIPGAMHLTPGNNTTSLIWYRMSQRNANFMPPLASTVADATGAQRLEEWIDGLTSCPAPTGPLPCGGPPNRVDNCTFDMGTGDWEYRPNDGGAASLSVAGGELNINVTASGPNNWDPQVVQNLGSVPMGNYVIQFSARAAVPRNIVVNAGQDYAPYASRCPPERTVALTTTMQHFTLTCNTNANESSLKLDFNVGAAGPSTVTIDNVYFGPPR